jgi:cytochrome b
MRTHQQSTSAGSEPLPAEVRVWDPFVRMFHWSLAGLFMFAFATGDEWDKPHELAGYAIAGLIALRLIWGFCGPRHARFSDFVRSPRQVFAFMRQTMQMRAPRYLGHNPAGGAMVIALLSAISVISLTGYMMTTDSFWGVEWVEEVHEVSVYATLGLIALHVLGVIVASSEHSENLVLAMFTGRKRR